MGRQRFKIQPKEVQEMRLKQVKLELCFVIRRVAMRNGLKQKELAELLATSESSISRIIRLRLESISFKQLIRFSTALPDNFDFNIAV